MTFFFLLILYVFLFQIYIHTYHQLSRIIINTKKKRNIEKNYNINVTLLYYIRLILRLSVNSVKLYNIPRMNYYKHAPPTHITHERRTTNYSQS